MRKFFGLSFLFALLLSFGLMASMPMTSYAIDEVTPTPSPNQEEEESDSDEIDVEALLDDGIELLSSGDFEEAIENMDIVLEVDEENTRALFIRGIALAQIGEFEASIDDFDTAIEIQPWVYEFYLYRGDVYRLAGNSTDALLDYEAAIDINPINANAYFRRSDLSYELGDDDTGDFDDLMVRAIEAAQDGDTDTALDFLDEATEADVDGSLIALAYYMRGSINMSNGENEDAFDDFTNAIEADDEMDNAYLARGILYRLDGDIEAAGQDFFLRMDIKIDEAVSETMEIGETIEIEMAYRRVVRIEFEGEAGQELTLSAREIGEAATDPLIVLLDPDGNPIAGDDDFGVGINGLDSEIEDFELPEDGTYMLLVSHAEGAYFFGFNGLIEVEIND